MPQIVKINDGVFVEGKPDFGNTHSGKHFVFALFYFNARFKFKAKAFDPAHKYSFVCLERENGNKVDIMSFKMSTNFVSAGIWTAELPLASLRRAFFAHGHIAHVIVHHCL